MSHGVSFGLIVNGDEPPDRDPLAIVDGEIEGAVAARDAGFGSISVAHRYSYGPAADGAGGKALTTWRTQPFAMLAHLAALLRDTVRYQTSVLVSPGLHPVQLAEDVATLDALCRGRLRLGIALGWMPYEFQAFGVAARERGERFTELLRAYRMLFEADEVNFLGRFFQLAHAHLVARPVQRPMPPLWVGASSPPAVRRAAELGDALIMSAHMDLATLKRQRGQFAELRIKAGRPPVTQVPISRLVVIADDRETALREVRPLAEQWYRRRGEVGWFVTNGPDADIKLIGDGRWIVGDPDDCAAQVRQLRDELGVTDIICTLPPHIGQKRRLQTIELLGRHVIPEFRPVPEPLGE